MGSFLRLFRVFLFFWILNLAPSFGQFLPSSFPLSSLVLKRGEAQLSLGLEWMESDSFYTQDGDSISTLSNSTRENYYDVISYLTGSYGISPYLTAWLQIPWVFRKETENLNTKEMGLGDVKAGIRFLMTDPNPSKIQFAFEFSSKFPTGDTNRNFLENPPKQLPLGTGDSALSPAILLKKAFGPWGSLELETSYTFRLPSTVEYLNTQPFLFTSGDGTFYALPIGNLEIDWGDEFRLGGKGTWSFHNLCYGVSGSFLHRQTTQVRDFSFETKDDHTDISAVVYSSGSGYLFSVSPFMGIQLTQALEGMVRLSFPAIGNNFPLPSLGFVESLSGTRFQMEFRYVF